MDLRKGAIKSTHGSPMCVYVRADAQFAEVASLGTCKKCVTVTSHYATRNETY